MSQDWRCYGIVPALNFNHLQTLYQEEEAAATIIEAAEILGAVVEQPEVAEVLVGKMAAFRCLKVAVREASNQSARIAIGLIIQLRSAGIGMMMTARRTATKHPILVRRQHIALIQTGTQLQIISLEILRR